MESSCLELLHEAAKQAVADKHYAGATKIFHLIEQFDSAAKLQDLSSVSKFFSGCFFSDWIAQRGCSKSTAYRMRAELRGALGVEFEKRRNGKAIEVWLSPEHQELLNGYASALDRGLGIGDALATLGRPDLSNAALEAVSAAAKDAQLTIYEGIEHPPRQEGFWLELLIRKYIPIKIEQGERYFSSPELIKWIDEFSQVELTEYDLREDSKTVLYKRMISNALGELKRKNVLCGKPRSKRYFINKAAFEALQRSNALP
jgi:hypothetical protein